MVPLQEITPLSHVQPARDWQAAEFVWFPQGCGVPVHAPVVQEQLYELLQLVWLRDAHDGVPVHVPDQLQYGLAVPHGVCANEVQGVPVQV
jgi:hypothetical protein